MRHTQEHHSPPEPNPFAAGQAAYKRGGNPHTINPYRKHSREWVRWVNGWDDAQRSDVMTRELPAWTKEVTK